MRSTLRGQVLAILPAWAIVLAPAQAANLIDHHQHLMSPQALSVFSAPKAITAADLIAEMDTAGIDRAVVLSAAATGPAPPGAAPQRARSHRMNLKPAFMAVVAV
jgi:hypothetical protein